MRYNFFWSQIVKLGKLKVLELAKQLGVFDRAYAPFVKRQRGAYFKCCSIVYHAQKNQSTGEFKYYRTMNPTEYIPFIRTSSLLKFHQSEFKAACAVSVNRAKVWHRYYYVSRDELSSSFLTIRAYGNDSRNLVSYPLKILIQKAF